MKNLILNRGMFSVILENLQMTISILKSLLYFYYLNNTPNLNNQLCLIYTKIPLITPSLADNIA